MLGAGRGYGVGSVNGRKPKIDGQSRIPGPAPGGADEADVRIGRPVPSAGIVLVFVVIIVGMGEIKVFQFQSAG
jgi:hypothetical protein